MGLVCVFVLFRVGFVLFVMTVQRGLFNQSSRNFAFTSQGELKMLLLDPKSTIAGMSFDWWTGLNLFSCTVNRVVLFNLQE